MKNDFFDKVSPRVLEIARLMAAQSQTLALAESCTGGLAASSIAAHAGVSSFFLGGVVSYHRHVKQDILLVSSDLITARGEVDLDVAKAMAQGAKQQLKSDWAIGITGIAGPSGGSAEKPVGLVCFGLVGPHLEKSVSERFGHGSRQDIQQQSVLFAFDLLLNAMR